MEHDCLRTLPEGMREALLPEIDVGETVRWCGQPNARITHKKAWVGARVGAIFFGGMSLVLFSVPWLMAYGADELFLQQRRGPDNGLLVSAALFMTFAVVALDGPRRARKRARRTVYALTDTRVLTLEVRPKGEAVLREVEPAHPLQIARHDNREKDSSQPPTGTIEMYPSGATTLVRLLNVEHPREVERLIRATFDPPK